MVRMSTYILLNIFKKVLLANIANKNTRYSVKFEFQINNEYFFLI